MPQHWYCPTFCNNTNTASTTQVIWPNWPTGNAIASMVTKSYPQNWYQTTSTDQTMPTYQDEVWRWWVSNLNAPSWGSYVQVQPYVQPYTETAADLEARQERERERVAARARARVLLGEFLSDDQKVELEKHGRFHVTGSRGRRYCIRTTGQAGNVDLLKPDGQIQASLCCHPREGLPDGDAWLMQMIEIRHDEDHFLRTANVQRGSLPVAA